VKAIFFPTAVIGVQDALEESALMYTDACNHLLKQPFVSLLRSAAIGGLSLCIVCVSSLLLLGNTRTGYLVVLMTTFLFAGVFSYSAYQKYKTLPTVCSLAKAYIRLDILPFGEADSFLHCAWLRVKGIHCSQPASQAIKKSFYPLSGNLVSLDKEAEFLWALNGIAETAKSIGGYDLHVRFVRLSDVLASSFARIAAEGTACEEAHRRYIDFYSPSIAGTELGLTKNLHTAVATLNGDQELLEQARRFLVQQSQKALSLLASLRDASLLSLDSRSQQILASYEQAYRENVRTPLVKHLMFETRKKAEEELEPMVDEVNAKYHLLRTEITDRYERRIIGTKAQLEEAQLRIQDQIDRHKANLATCHRRLTDRRRRKTRLSLDIEKTSASLSKAKDQATEAQVLSWFEPSEIKVLHYQQTRQLAQLNTRMLEGQLSHFSQQLDTLNSEIWDLDHQISEEEKSIERKQDELRQLETDFREKIRGLSGEEKRRLEQIEQHYQTELRNARIPLIQIEEREEQLLRAWGSLIDQGKTEHDKAVTQYRKATEAILAYRRKAARTLSDQAVLALEELKHRIRQSQQQIESFLWPRDLWRGCNVLFIPIWLLVYRTHAKEGDKVVPLPLDLTDKSGETPWTSYAVSSLPGLNSVLQEAVEVHSQALMKYAQYRSILSDTMYLSSYLPAWIDRLRKQGQVGPLLAALAVISLRNQRTARFEKLGARTDRAH
jgi:hypothetical protein